MDSAGGYDDSYFSLLERLEPDSFWFRSRNRLIVWAVRTYSPDATTLLEVGCGTGFVLAALSTEAPQIELTGVEPSSRGLEVARRRLPHVPLLEMDAGNLHFNAEFDVVTAFDVLEHIEDDDGALSKMRQAVRPGGHVMLTVPQHPRLWSAADEAASHARRYTRHELVEKVERVGLAPLRVTSFMTLLLPLMALSRLRERGKVSGYDFEKEFRRSRRARFILEPITSLERLMIEHGASFPVGGSLLVVAERPT